jgi:hypothetical protein
MQLHKPRYIAETTCEFLIIYIYNLSSVSTNVVAPEPKATIRRIILLDPEPNVGLPLRGGLQKRCGSATQLSD